VTRHSLAAGASCGGPSCAGLLLRDAGVAGLPGATFDLHARGRSCEAADRARCTEAGGVPVAERTDGYGDECARPESRLPRAPRLACSWAAGAHAETAGIRRAPPSRLASPAAGDPVDRHAPRLAGIEWLRAARDRDHQHSYPAHAASVGCGASVRNAPQNAASDIGVAGAWDRRSKRPRGEQVVQLGALESSP